MIEPITLYQWLKTFDTGELFYISYKGEVIISPLSFNWNGLPRFTVNGRYIDLRYIQRALRVCYAND